MSNLKPTDFPAFFAAVYGYEAFPWQKMLVERIAESGWPEGIDLPTASGKTACIDAAVFLLALGAQEGRLQEGHPARRRIFFVVDRRIVVDEAYERALRLAEKLRAAQDGVVKQVADSLREIAGPESPEPLVVSRLRGGTVKDERWRLSPAQPAVITSTVDQLGSRLLFRSYGSSNLSAPIEAALTGCDSLVLLDEAHCAVPFMQTARSVQRYSGEGWSEEPIISPLTFSILSATLPQDVADIFPSPEQRVEALAHPGLQKRLNAPKPAALVEVKAKKGSDDCLVIEAAQRASAQVKDGRERIAVMVNRVATATAVYDVLRQSKILDADVVLMTGRMRPLDRDALVARWSPSLASGSKLTPSRPIIVVTTQCLEVGADFSFDALITECASLDALRQRFGRLNRLGTYDHVDAAVLIRSRDVKPQDKLDDAKPIDPIYGNAMARTWQWLCANQHKGDRFDFGIAATQAKIPTDVESLAPLLAPSPNAPVLLPAHIDLLCQTAPTPTPDPDTGPLLHGPQRSIAEARIVFRADLGETAKEDWLDAAALLPPVTAECLTVPLWLLQSLLSGDADIDGGAALGDVESQQRADHRTTLAPGQACVIWRGRGESLVTQDPKDIRPHDTVVLPADEQLAARLGAAFTRPADSPLDVAEPAYQHSRDQCVLRLVAPVLKQEGLGDLDSVRGLLSWAKDEDREHGALPELLLGVAHDADDHGVNIPGWLQNAAATLATSRHRRPSAHPAGGLVLVVPPPPATVAASDLDFGDIDDALSGADEPVELTMHTQHVVTRAKAWAERCLPAFAADALACAAQLHDLGKADARFQILLHGDELQAAVAMANGKLLAKSDGAFLAPSAQRRLRHIASLPDHFRHEMLSMQLAEVSADRLKGEADLVLHLIAAHHGHARPFAPVCIDEDPPSLEIGEIALAQDQRRKLVPPHRLDSGVAARFWNLTRRYGWWGLSYVESVLRLADRAASAAEAAVSKPPRQEIHR